MSARLDKNRPFRPDKNHAFPVKRKPIPRRTGTRVIPSSITAPVATARRGVTQRPSVKAAGQLTRVAHREYLGDVTGSVAFAMSKTLSVNPGLSATFPWLSRIALQYETYFIRKLVFEYETQESTATAGTVMMAIDYDPSDVAPTSKTQLLSYKGAVRSPGWAPVKMVAAIPAMNVHGPGRFVRGGLIANTDIKLYDIGNLHVATQGFAGATVAGELYVSYVVDLVSCVGFVLRFRYSYVCSFG